MRWGLAAKLFAILTLLGAIAVLVTGVLGYMRARDTLQEAIYNELTVCVYRILDSAILVVKAAENRL